MNRTWLTGSMPSSAICSAVSSCAAEPEPLSLMPGPSITESRCAPDTTTRSVRPVVGRAITFSDSRTSDTVLVVTVKRHLRPAAASASMNSTSSAPASALISMTGTSCGKLA